MKVRLLSLLICVVLILSVSGISYADMTMLPYTQYASGGTATDLEAVILYEDKNKTFTKYQVAYTSCTCRGAENNFRSVMYIEILNTKDTPEEASIRQISFGDLNGVTVGMWGDSNPIYMQPDYTKEYMDENFVQTLVGTNKAQYDAWEGYGHQIDSVDVDAVSGATVSTSNITSVIKALMQYHTDKYYK